MVAAALADKEPYFFERWVRDEWGRFGVRALDRSFGGARRYLQSAAGFERAQVEFSARLREQLALGR